MRSVMRHNFSEVPKSNYPRSAFDRSHGYKTSFDAGFLVPVFLDEVLPGDTHIVNMQGFARMATPIHPVMDNIFLQSFFFFVPKRLVWLNYDKFHGAQENPGDSIDYLIPTVTKTDGWDTGSIGDYFGLPVGVTNLETNSLPLRCYNLIYNEWFRSQDLQDSKTVNKNDGPDPDSIYALFRRCKKHDYFSASLPSPQKGDSVDIPLGSLAPVGTSTTAGSKIIFDDFNGDGMTALINTQPEARYGTTVATGNVFADLTNATAATINQLRQAFQIQRLQEKDQRGGTRYTEMLRSQFGVTSPDGRLQRPEYLGGGQSMVNIASVPQTSESGTTEQGNLAAYGTVSLRNHGFSKSFTEHGYIIGLINARADITYSQGLHKLWSRQTRYDFYMPVLQALGEQAVLSKEIYLDGTAGDEDVWGYQGRWDDYRYKPSQVTGLMRPNVTAGNQSLDVWNLTQDYASRPVLDNAWIQDIPPIDRVIAVPSEPHFIFDAYFKQKSVRVMPVYGVPGMIDHF